MPLSTDVLVLLLNQPIDFESHLRIAIAMAYYCPTEVCNNCIFVINLSNSVGNTSSGG